MKILVFSDTHLGRKVDKKKYNFLEKIIKNSDFVVLNGDFWDRSQTTFKKFIESDWKGLFELLKAKGAHYNYGNHDQETWCDEQVKLFSNTQGQNMNLSLGDWNFHIEHGNKLLARDPVIDQLQKLPFAHIANKYEHLLCKIKSNNKHKRFGIISHENLSIKERLQNMLTPNTLCVCSHTHTGEVDLAHSFINTGSIRFGYAQYLTIENGKPLLHFERY
jgi:predicted phosphodiesterase